MSADIIIIEITHVFFLFKYMIFSYDVKKKKTF